MSDSDPTNLPGLQFTEAACVTVEPKDFLSGVPVLPLNKMLRTEDGELLAVVKRDGRFEIFTFTVAAK